MQLSLFKSAVLPAWIIPLYKIVTSKDTGKWCLLPYPGHPRGCPNYGKKEHCPPRAPAIENYFNTARPLFFVHSEFDLEKHVSKMRDKHPKWSGRQLKCVLYWQGTSRKQLKERTKEAAHIFGTNAFTFIPEAMGLNVYVTARINGLKLERTRSLKICRHVALIGTLKKENE